MFYYVILSEVLLDEGENNIVEGSHVVHKILRLRNTPLTLRLASLRMTFYK